MYEYSSTVGATYFMIGITMGCAVALGVLHDRSFRFGRNAGRLDPLARQISLFTVLWMGIFWLPILLWSIVAAGRDDDNERKW